LFKFLHVVGIRRHGPIFCIVRSGVIVFLSIFFDLGTIHEFLMNS